MRFRRRLAFRYLPTRGGEFTIIEMIRTGETHTGSGSGSGSGSGTGLFPGVTMNTQPQTFGRYLKRLQGGRTTRQMAALLGITHTAWQNYCNDKVKKIPVDFCRRVAAVAGRPEEEVLREAGILAQSQSTTASTTASVTNDASSNTISNIEATTLPATDASGAGAAHSPAGGRPVEGSGIIVDHETERARINQRIDGWVRMAALPDTTEDDLRYIHDQIKALRLQLKEIHAASGDSVRGGSAEARPAHNGAGAGGIGFNKETHGFTA